MTCKNCSAHLPDESRFCPYCMTRFDNKGSKERKSKKSKEAIFAALLIALTMTVAAAIAIFIKTSNKEPQTSEPEEIYLQQSETTTPSTESETVTVEINGDYYTPGTYFWSINGNGKVVLEDYEYYPF